MRRVVETPGGDMVFAIKSMTRPDGPTHEPAINLESGECECTCEHYDRKLAPLADRDGVTISLKTPDRLCKHLRKCLENLERKGVRLPSSMERNWASTTVARIPLKPAGFVLVDIEDFEWLSQWNWRLHTGGYAMRLQRDHYYQHPIYMHRLLSGATGEEQTDHINRNRLDNRRANLRVVTCGENLANREKAACNTSGYKGVARTRSASRWRVETRFGGEYKNLGTFGDPAEAARVYDTAAFAFYGDNALLNFPDEASRALETLARNGQLPQQHGQFTPACNVCGQLDADHYFPMSDGQGNAVPNAQICCECAYSRMDDLRDAAPDDDAPEGSVRAEIENASCEVREEMKAQREARERAEAIRLMNEF